LAVAYFDIPTEFRFGVQRVNLRAPEILSRNAFLNSPRGLASDSMN
jgi:hypothetical protein